MRAYLIRRLLLMIPTLFLVTLIVFFLVRFIPGSVIDLMIAEMMEETEEMSDLGAIDDLLKHKLGLDVPVYIQYGRWTGVIPHPDTGFSGLFQGNLGRSLWGDWPIRDELVRRLPITVELGVLAIVLAWSIALPIGIYSAIRQDSLADYAGRSFAIMWLALPGFWLATIVTVYPSIWWNWSPPILHIPLTEDVSGNLRQFMLPAFLMGMAMSGSIVRYTRTMMLEVLRQDYIRTAWAKGLTERTVIYRHALKNALIPLITIVGMEIPQVIGGSVIMETIFSLPGIGRLMITALNQRDYPIVSAINLTMAAIILVVNLIVDLSYAYLDPRVVYK